MPKEVKRWETKNGKLFKKEKEALEYEAHEEAYKALQDDWYDQAVECFSDLTNFLQLNRSKVLNFLKAVDSPDSME
jgi:hypothetical protein